MMFVPVAVSEKLKQTDRHTARQNCALYIRFAILTTTAIKIYYFITVAIRSLQFLVPERSEVYNVEQQSNQNYLEVEAPAWQ